MLILVATLGEKTQVIRVREGKAEKVSELCGRVSVAGWREAEAIVATHDGKIWMVRAEGAQVEQISRVEDGMVKMIDWHILDHAAILVEQDGKILVINYNLQTEQDGTKLVKI